MLILNIQMLRKMISAKAESLPTQNHYRSDKMCKISSLFESANMAFLACGNLPQNVIFWAWYILWETLIQSYRLGSV